MSEPVVHPRRVRLRAHSGEASPELAIMAATETLLETRRLREVSVSAIIEAAGVSRPTFYFYFPSKYAVVTTLLQRVFDEIYQSVGPWVERGGDESPEASLRAVLHRASGVWHQHAAAIRAAHENEHADPELGALWFSMLERFRVVLADEIRRVQQTDDHADGIEPELLSATLIWASERTLYMTIRGDDPQLRSPGAGAEGLLAIWLPAIYGIAYTAPPLPDVVR